jgi:hypothetical protein
MESFLETFLRMVQREPMAFDTNATVKIEARLLDLGSRDHGAFPYLP